MGSSFQILNCVLSNKKHFGVSATNFCCLEYPWRISRIHPEAAWHASIRRQPFGVQSCLPRWKWDGIWGGIRNHWFGDLPACWWGWREVGQGNTEQWTLGFSETWNPIFGTHFSSLDMSWLYNRRSKSIENSSQNLRGPNCCIQRKQAGWASTGF